MKKWSITLLFWYFSFAYSHADFPEVHVMTVVTGFKNLLECQQEYSRVKPILDDLNDTIKWNACREKKEL